MTITPTSLSLGGLATGSGVSSEDAKNSIGQTYDQFLTLLTTQLKNQDPLNPMDSKDFTNQLVQFASVEQQIAQNEKLESLLSLSQAGTINGAVGFIGKKVNYEGQNFHFDGSNPIDMSYYIAENAKTVKISISDQDGNVLWTTDGEKAAGEHQMTWDGIDNDGDTVESGIYTVEVGAVDSEDQSITTGMMVSGTIDGVEVVDGTVMLRIQDMIIGIDTVLSVKS